MCVSIYYIVHNEAGNALKSSYTMNKPLRESLNKACGPFMPTSVP